MLVAGVDYDSFGVYIALVDAGDLSLRELIVIRYRDKAREADASFTFPASLRIPEALRSSLDLPGRRAARLAFVERGLAPRGLQKHLFTMGRAQGLIVATLLELGVTVEELRPAEWRHELGVPGNCSKAEAHERLASIYDFTLDRRLMSEEDVRDALAIAYAGARRNARDTAA